MYTESIAFGLSFFCAGTGAGAAGIGTGATGIGTGAGASAGVGTFTSFLPVIANFFILTTVLTDVVAWFSFLFEDVPPGLEIGPILAIARVTRRSATGGADNLTSGGAILSLGSEVEGTFLKKFGCRGFEETGAIFALDVG
jgi:hypothetical protein